MNFAFLCTIRSTRHAQSVRGDLSNRCKDADFIKVIRRLVYDHAMACSRQETVRTKPNSRASGVRAKRLHDLQKVSSETGVPLTMCARLGSPKHVHAPNSVS